MRTCNLGRCSLVVPFLVTLGSTIVILLGTGRLAAQVTQVYSFEPDLEGFAANGVVDVSLNTDGNFVSEGSNSMKLEFPSVSTFAGPATTMLPPAFTDPAGIQFVLIDLINTNRYVPENPVVGTDPTFANMSITFFGSYVDDPGTPSDVQFLFSEQSVGTLEPGTHQVKIDLTNGGIDPQFMHPGIQGYNQWVAEGFVPSGFYIYLNKNFGTTAPFAWTIYLDNIRVGNSVAGDYNGNGTVDAADYTVWRDHLGLVGSATAAEGDGTGDGDVTQADYDFWKNQFDQPMGVGGVASSAVPEPKTILLLSMAVIAYSFARR